MCLCAIGSAEKKRLKACAVNGINILIKIYSFCLHLLIRAVCIGVKGDIGEVDNVTLRYLALAVFNERLVIGGDSTDHTIGKAGNERACICTLGNYVARADLKHNAISASEVGVYLNDLTVLVETVAAIHNRNNVAKGYYLAFVSCAVIFRILALVFRKHLVYPADKVLLVVFLQRNINHHISVVLTREAYVL